jgi:chromosome segregation ATPase
MSYITIGLGVILATVVGAFYWYFNHSQEQIQALLKDKATLEIAVKEQQAAIDAMQKHAEEQAQQVQELQAGLADANSDKAQLEKKLRQHDLQVMAQDNPALLEERMNRATQRVWRDLEKTTGGQPSPLPDESTKPNATAAVQPAAKDQNKTHKSLFKKMENTDAVAQ